MIGVVLGIAALLSIEPARNARAAATAPSGRGAVKGRVRQPAAAQVRDPMASLVGSSAVGDVVGGGG